MKYIVILLLSLGLLFSTGCDRKTGDMLTMLELPTDYALDLYSANEGVYPNTSVLQNPANPFAHANINMQNVWDFNDSAPSAKAKFYLWATMLTQVPMGEHQYFTAKSLHELYTLGGSINAREQAKKAYRATLDHFFDDVTWWKADWIIEDTYYAVLLRNLVAQSMYDPSEMNMLPLYTDPVLALADLSEWGYVYDFETGIVSRRN